MSEIGSPNAEPELFAVHWLLTAGTNADLSTVPMKHERPRLVAVEFRHLRNRSQRSVSHEMTIAQAIADPMIALLNEADRVAEGSFAQLLESADRVLKCADSHRDLK